MPRMNELRSVFANLGLEEPPDWVPRLEAALEPVKLDPAEKVPEKRYDILSSSQQQNHISFATWWCKWFGIETPPEWMKSVPELNTLYAVPEQNTLEEQADEDHMETIKILKESKPPKIGKKEKNILLRTAEQWPARKKVIFVKGNKNSLQKKMARLNRRGKMVITKVVAPRIFDKDIHKKRIDFSNTKKDVIHTLAGDVKVAKGEIRYERISTTDKKFVYHHDFISEKILLGYELCKGHDIALAIAEQKEKTNGLEVTKGCVKPRWMSQEDWKKRQAIPLFTYLNTDWMASYGIQNPDLKAKFSGFDSEPDSKAKSGSK